MRQEDYYGEVDLVCFCGYRQVVSLPLPRPPALEPEHVRGRSFADAPSPTYYGPKGRPPLTERTARRDYHREYQRRKRANDRTSQLD